MAEQGIRIGYPYPLQTQCFWQLRNYLDISSVHTKEEFSDKSPIFHYYGGGKALIFSSDELHLYVSADLHEQQYQLLQCVKQNDKQHIDLNDDDIQCTGTPRKLITPCKSVPMTLIFSLMPDAFYQYLWLATLSLCNIFQLDGMIGKADRNQS